MFIAENENKERIEAVDSIKGRKYFCPCCGSEVRPNQGTVKAWYFSHINRDCDPWYEPMTLWHKEWQEMFDPKFREIPMEYDGEKHRADIKIDHMVVEFQHSYISPEDFKKRNDFYSRDGVLVWLVDRKGKSIDGFLKNRPIERKPKIFLFIEKDDGIYEVDTHFSSEIGKKYTKEEFMDRLREIYKISELMEHLKKKSGRFKITETSLKGSFFFQCTFQNITFEGIDFTYSTFKEVKFINCTFIETKFNRVTMEKCTVEKCMIQSSILEGMRIGDCLIENTKVFKPKHSCNASRFNKIINVTFEHREYGIINLEDLQKLKEEKRLRIEKERAEWQRKKEEKERKKKEERERQIREEEEKRRKEEAEYKKKLEEKQKEYQEAYEKMQAEKQEKERKRKEKEQQEAERKEKAKIKYLTKIDDIPLSRIAEVWDMYNIQKWENVKEWVLTKEVKNLIDYAFRMYEKEHYPQISIWDK